MKIQQQNGIVSTINFSPFFETEECMSLRSSLFNKAIAASNISPRKQLDVYDETILVFENMYQALNFLTNIVRIAVKMDKYSNLDINLRLSLCCGNYFIHHDQIYGDAVNLATKLSYSSRVNEMLVCGIDSQVIENFTNSQSDITYFVRDIDQNCFSIGLLDDDMTHTTTRDRVLKIDCNDLTETFASSRSQKITIGRSSETDVAIESDLISRNHATLTLNYDEIFIEDHSANGTYLYFEDRELFLKNDTLKLSSNGHISCGISMYSSSTPRDIISYHLCDSIN